MSLSPGEDVFCILDINDDQRQMRMVLSVSAKRLPEQMPQP
jgi:hypothetical protein